MKALPKENPVLTRSNGIYKAPESLYPATINIPSTPPNTPEEKADKKSDKKTESEFVFTDIKGNIIKPK